MNFHMGIQHHNDGGRDDVQLLWDSSSLNNSYYSSTNDQGGPAFVGGTNLGVPFYFDGFQSNCAAGAVFNSTTTPTQCVSTYLFPNYVAAASTQQLPDRIAHGDSGRRPRLHLEQPADR